MKKLSLILIALATLVMVGCKTSPCPHFNTEDKVKYEARCGVDGLIEVYCTECFALVDTKPIPAKAHTVGEPERVNPTCTEAGKLDYCCTECFALVDTKPSGEAATGHNWVDTDCADNEKVPSAKYYEVSEGVYKFEKVDVSPKYKCSICGEEHEKTIAFFDSPTTIGVAKGVNCNDWEEPELRLDTTWTVEKYNSYYENRNSYSSVCNCGGECVGNCGGSTCDCNKLTCIRLVPTDRNTNILYFGSYYIEY